MDLREVSTQDLVAELESRDGVEVNVIGPSAAISITESGPVVVLVVTD